MFRTQSLAPKAFVVTGPRGVWRYVFASAKEAHSAINQARFSELGDWLPFEKALKAYAKAIATRSIDI